MCPTPVTTKHPSRSNRTAKAPAIAIAPRQPRIPSKHMPRRSGKWPKQARDQCETTKCDDIAYPGGYCVMCWTDRFGDTKFRPQIGFT